MYTQTNAHADQIIPNLYMQLSIKFAYDLCELQMKNHEPCFFVFYWY